MTLFLSLIIQKELRSNLLNARFVVACLVATGLILCSVAILTDSYKHELADYQGRVRAQDEFVDQYGHLNRYGAMTFPARGPSSYQPLVLGIDPEVLEGGFLSDPIPLFFARLDVATIVTIIMSLIAILFSYNALCGEREEGLLKQMLSTSVSRSTIVFGKFIGGCLSLIVPFTIGLLAGLVYIAVSPNIQVRSVDLAVFFLLSCASYLYITAFYGLGLFFSSRSQSSNVALLKSLFAWVVLVLVVPNVSPFVAARIYRIPSKTVMQNQIWSINSERFGIQERRTQDLLKSDYSDIADVVVDAAHIVGHVKNNIQEKVTTDPHFRERYDKFSREWRGVMEEINKELQSRMDKIQNDYNEREKHQENLATMLASFSPLANYVFVATDLADAGIPAADQYQRELKSWGNAMGEYANAKIQTETRKNPAFTDEDHVDLSDRPRFEYKPLGIGEKLGLVLPHAGVLALFNLIFLTGALTSFFRYDVR